MPHYSRKKGSGSRDLGLNSNGKGSACRITDNKAFAENYDAIDWGHEVSEAEADYRADEGGNAKGEPPFVPVFAKPLPLEEV